MSLPATGVSSAATRSGVEVRLEGLSRHYGDVMALDGLDLTLHPGELVVLLGPSGCGKTTTLRLLAGLEDADTGRVMVGGQDVTRRPANKRDMGMVFQAYSLFPHMTVKDNVAFGLKLRRKAKAERDKRAMEMLELVGLTEQAGRYAHQLSGGQQQRVALARALAIQPQVLLLDEPLSALDAKVRAQLRDEIRRIQLEVGTTTLFVTHDQEEALAIADRVGVMRDGRIEQLGSPTDVYTRPATPFVAEFVGLSNRLAGEVTGSGTVVVRGAELPLVDIGVPAGQVVALVRPEAVSVASGESAEAGPADRNGARHHVPRRDQPRHRRPGRHDGHGRDGHGRGHRAFRRAARHPDDPAQPGARLRRLAGRGHRVSGGHPPLTTHRRLGPGAVLRSGASADYRAIEVIDGEPHVVRGPMGMPGAPPDPGPGRPLLCLAHVTDLQIADVQSPTRFEFLNRLFADPRYAQIVPVQRPQEALTLHAVDATVRTLNNVRGPATGQPPEFAVTTGDAIDNAQWNELQNFFALFDGGLAAPDSGGTRYEGVQALDWPDDIFWKPDGVAAGGPDVFRREFGFPDHPGLLARALREFQAGGPGDPLAVVLRQPRGAQPGRRHPERGPRQGAHRRPQAARAARRLRPRPGARGIHHAPRGVHGGPVACRHRRSRPPADHPAGVRGGPLPARGAPRRARLRRAQPAGRHRLLRLRHPGGAADRAGHHLPGRRRRRLPGP